MLDGLRAYAFLAVFAFHTDLPGTSGGYLGVDVFFVLSGYLITGILLRDQDRDGIRLTRFYVRRAARLWPALILAVTLAVVLDAIHPEPDGMKPVYALVALAYLTDLYPGFTGPLSHTWSLAVEEQFYLLWPLAVIVVRSRRALMWLAGVGAVASLVLFWTSHQPEHEAKWAGVVPLDHAWELLAGCLLALALHHRAVSARVAGVCLWAGSVTLLATIAVGPLLSDGNPRPAWQKVTAEMATVALVLAMVAGRGRVLFAAAPLRWVGRISYGAYLYHFPLILVTNRAPGVRVVNAGICLAVTLGLAWLSYRLVEQPILRRARPTIEGQPRRRMDRDAVIAVPAESTRVPVASASEPPLSW